MLRRVYYRVTSNWSAEISLLRARLSWVSLCFTMIPPSLLAHWIKPHRHINVLAKSMRQIVCPGNCANDIRITPEVRSTFSFAPLWQRACGTRRSEHCCQLEINLIALRHG